MALAFYQQGSVSTVTFGDLYGDIVRQAQAPDAMRRGELVFLSSRTDYPSIIGYFAALHNDAHPAYLAPLTPRQDRDIFHSELATLVERFAPNCVLADTFDGDRRHERPFFAEQSPGFIQFSSGTTGLRKGVFISEERLIAQLHSLGAAVRITSSDSVASWLPLYHDMGLITSLFMPLYFGISVSFLDPVEWSFRPELLLQVAASARATLCWQPDFAFRHILNRYNSISVADTPDLSSLRMLINCSEPCRVQTFARFQERFQSSGLAADCLQTSYAMAENVFAVTQSAFRGSQAWQEVDGFLSSGIPIPDCAIRIAATSGPADAGEVEISSRFLFDGYLNNSDSGERFVGGWFRTGDVGYIRQGHLYVVGRKDDTLVINGRKILAHQLEDHVGLCPGVKPGRVICVAEPNHSAVSFFYEGAELNAGLILQIKRWCSTASGVSVNKVAKVQEGTIVKSSSGKLARSKTMDKLARLRLT